MNVAKQIFEDSIEKRKGQSQYKEDPFFSKVESKLTFKNNTIKERKKEKYGNVSVQNAQKFSNDRNYRTSICSRLNFNEIYNYLRYLFNSIIECKHYSEIEVILSENYQSITDILNYFNFNIPLLDEIISHIFEISFKLGNYPICFNNYSNKRINDKIEKGLSEYNNNNSHFLLDKMSISDLEEYIKYLALSNTLFDEEHLNYLFFQLKRYDSNSFNESINKYWTMLMVKYTNLLANKYNIKDLIVLTDQEHNYTNANKMGFATMFKYNNKKYNIINLIVSNIKCWQMDIEMIVHELEHVSLNNDYSFSFNSFMMSMESLIEYAISISDIDRYHSSNYYKRFTEIKAYQKNILFEKELENNSDFIDLDKLDLINQRLNYLKQYLLSTTRQVGEDEYYAFTLFRMAVKKYKLYHLAKNGIKSKEKLIFPQTIELLLDENKEVLSYEEIKKRFDENEIMMQRNPNDKKLQTIKIIYAWALHNYTNEMDKINKNNYQSR